MSKNFLGWSQHLYVRIYAAVLLSLAVVALLLFSLWRWFPELVQQQMPQNLDALADYASEVLPPAASSAETYQAAFQHRRWRRYAGLAVYDANGQTLATMGVALPAPELGRGNNWISVRPPIFVVHLTDGRWLVAQRTPFPPGPGRAQRINLPLWFGLIALALGIGAYPVARRMTRRLERLQTSVEALGDGQLSTRVAIEGRDEVARLAHSFNRSAERIEALVAAQKTLLANASHELRSPLARIRMAVELMQTQPDDQMRAEMVRNIGELDLLIDEILLASRLDAAGTSLPSLAPVDLTALVAEECARFGASLDLPQTDHNMVPDAEPSVSAPITFVGDAKLLHRLLRNLLENAQRYGDDSRVQVTLHVTASPQGRRAQIDVCDGGRGVPTGEREQIFAPFYRLPGARERDGGVGLGLSLVRQIARAHHGDVLCLTREDGAAGTCFRVTLPI